MQKVINSDICTVGGKVLKYKADFTGKKIAIYCDFDGTISIGDVVDILLEKLADPEWQTIEERWQKGEIDDCECMSQQISLIRGNWQNIVDLLANIAIDPHFKSFAEACNQAGIPVYIGSSGLDRVINYFLDREKIKVSGLWAYKLVESNGNWSLQFPESSGREGCHVIDSIACKCILLDSAGNDIFKIVIGDGRSDFCWVNKADIVFAKSKVAQYCNDKNLEYIAYENFAEINSYLQSILREV